jgi:hypothetical protein
LTKTDAKVGLKSVERVEIVSGIKPGEHVVISPVQGMSEGQIVSYDVHGSDGGGGDQQAEREYGELQRVQVILDCGLRILD